MVDIEGLRDAFRKFREEFWEDVTDLNLKKGGVKLEEIKTKMTRSSYFKAVQDFARERGWEIENLDLKISAMREGETVELNLVECEGEDTLFIKPWSKVLEELKKLED